MKLKLIGADCSNGMKILKNIKKLERELDHNIDVDKISIKDKNKYHVNVVPTLILNNQILSEGYVISERELKNYLKPLIESV